MVWNARVSLRSLAEERRLPPAWARGAQPSWGFWYFANRFGEPWVARQVGQELLVSGAEIGWQEVRVKAGEAEARLADLRRALPSGRFMLTGKYLLSLEEALWLAAVISAALLPLSVLRGHANQRPGPAPDQPLPEQGAHPPAGAGAPAVDGSGSPEPSKSSQLGPRGEDSSPPEEDAGSSHTDRAAPDGLHGRWRRRRARLARHLPRARRRGRERS